MRKLLLTLVALSGFAAGTAYAAGSTQNLPAASTGTTGPTNQNMTITQGQSQTAPRMNVAPAPVAPANPMDMSTWKFRAGPSPDAPRGGVGSGGAK
jgi:hypothetical protein